MKKLLALVLALAMICAVSAAMAEVFPADFFEVSGQVLTVHVPAGYSLVWDGAVEPELLTGGEVTDGYATYSYILPEGVAEDERYMMPLMQSDDLENYAAFGQAFVADEQGNLVSVSFYLYLDNPGMQLTYDQTGDAPRLFVELLTNPSTGFDWTYVPDNSGVFELVDTSYENYSEEAGAELVGTPMSVVFELSANAGLTQGSAMFTYARGEEAPVTTIVLNAELNEAGEIIAIDPTITFAEAAQ